jgi:hypothetical protein
MCSRKKNALRHASLHLSSNGDSNAGSKFRAHNRDGFRRQELE